MEITNKFEKSIKEHLSECMPKHISKDFEIVQEYTSFVGNNYSFLYVKNSDSFIEKSIEITINSVFGVNIRFIYCDEEGNEYNIDEMYCIDLNDEIFQKIESRAKSAFKAKKIKRVVDA